MNVCFVALAVPVRITASCVATSVPVTTHDVVAVHTICVSERPGGTVSATHVVDFVEAAPENTPSPDPSDPTTRHAEPVQVSTPADRIDAGSFSATHVPVAVDTCPARITGPEGDVPIAKHAVVREHATCESVVVAGVPGTFSSTHVSVVGDAPPARISGPDAVAALTKQAVVPAQTRLETALGAPGKLSLAHVWVLPLATPARTTGPDAVPTTKQAADPAQVSDEIDRRARPVPSASGGDQASASEGVVLMVAPMMTGPAPVVPMATQAVEEGHRTCRRKVTPHVAGGELAVQLDGCEGESTIAAAPVLPKPTATHAVVVHVDEVIFWMPFTVERSWEDHEEPERTLTAAVAPPAVPCPVTRHWNVATSGQLTAPSVTVESG